MADATTKRWQGIDVAGAPLVAHLVSTVPNWSGSFTSLCGQERRVKWQPVEDFAYPEVFSPCQRCEQLAA